MIFSEQKYTDLPAIPKEFEHCRSWIPKCNLPALGDKIFKMSKKASKFGLSSISMKVIEEGKYLGSVSLSSHTSIKKPMNFALVEVHGEALKLEGGWKLIAALEHERIDATKVTDDESVTNLNVVRTVPGETCPEAYRFADSFCDHCETDRYRRKTFVLADEEGKLKQVGSSCLKDFLGHVSPEALLAQAKFLRTIEKWFGGYTEPGSRYEDEWDIEEVLAITHQAISKFGWVSKARAEEEGIGSTAGEVKEQIYVRMGFWSTYKEFEAWENPSEHDFEMARKAIEWLDTYDLNNCTDYIYNCKVIAKNGTVRDRDFGIACSIIGSYKGHLAKQAGIAKKERIVSDHVGTVGKVHADNMVLEKEITFSGFYGPAAFLKFRDASGNIVVWKTKPQGLEEGKEYIVAGKVKEHSIYGKDKQTIITRASVKEA